jgi:hypothetical protein
MRLTVKKKKGGGGRKKRSQKNNNRHQCDSNTRSRKKYQISFVFNIARYRDNHSAIVPSLVSFGRLYLILGATS